MSLESAERVYQEGLEFVCALPEMRSLAGHTVGVLGCTGLVGGALMNVFGHANDTTLRDQPLTLVGLARRVPEHRIGYDFVAGSVADLETLKQLPACDYVLHVAGTASDYRKRAEETLAAQVLGVERALQRFRNTKGFIYLSSTRVYGRRNMQDFLTEDTPAHVTPMSLDNLYDSAKRLAESLCLSHALDQGTRALVVRPTNLYGLPTTLRSATMVSEFVAQGVRLGRITTQGNPESVRNHCCVLDLIQGLLLALAHGSSGRAYNLGSTEHLSTQEVATTVAAAFPNPPPITWSHGGVPDCQRISIARACSELGYLPRQRFLELAPAMVARLAALHGHPFPEYVNSTRDPL